MYNIVILDRIRVFKSLYVQERADVFIKKKISARAYVKQSRKILTTIITSTALC